MRIRSIALAAVMTCTTAVAQSESPPEPTGRQPHIVPSAAAKTQVDLQKLKNEWAEDLSSIDNDLPEYVDTWIRIKTRLDESTKEWQSLASQLSGNRAQEAQDMARWCRNMSSQAPPLNPQTNKEAAVDFFARLTAREQVCRLSLLQFSPSRAQEPPPVRPARHRR